MKKLLINLVSLSIIANQGFGFVPKTTVRPSGFRPVFAPMLVPQGRPDGTIDGAQQILARKGRLKPGAGSALTGVKLQISCFANLTSGQCNAT